MALTDKLTAIADAIREKMNTSASFTLNAMPGLIRSIQTGSTSTTGVPDDIVTEAKRVATGILSKKTGNSITFIAISDMHEMGDSDHSDASIIKRYRKANLNAGQGARVIAEKINPDFFANLGDLSWCSKTTTTHDLGQSLVNARGYTAGIEPLTECFFIPGNHDVGYNTGYFDENLVVGMIGNYRYKDFTAKKVRVICLNTADNTDGIDSCERISGEQLQWFTNALDLSAKSDAAKWSIIILSHHPLDYGSIKPTANCLAAYVNGTNYSATHDGMTISKDFTGKNLATVVANFHGHLHSLFVTDISGTTVKRIAIPNACFGRNNEYGTEATTYNKVDNGTGKNTAFNVISIDLTQKIIYADCFGAGYDRILSYGTADVTSYSVTNNLSNASTSNGAATVMGGSSYFAMITAKDGYELDTVTVKMSGVDITATAVSGSNISIPNVTGDIVITVTTTVVEDFEYGEFTNMVLTAEEKNSTATYNGVGYKNDTYPTEANDGSVNGIVCTGWIPYSWNPNNVLYIKGATLNINNNKVRMLGFNTKTSVNGSVGYTYGADRWVERIEIEQLGNKYYKLTPKTNSSEVKYIRLSLEGTGENLIVTINEQIHADNSGDGPGVEPGTYTNLVPTAVRTDGVTVFNGVGYMNGMYATNQSPNHYAADANCVTTGFIRMPLDVKAIYVKGASWQATDNDHCRVLAYSILGNTAALSQDFRFGQSTAFTVESLGDNYYKFTPSRTAFFRDEYWYCMSLVGTGENLIITHDEPIE